MEIVPSGFVESLPNLNAIYGIFELENRSLRIRGGPT